MYLFIMFIIKISALQNFYKLSEKGHSEKFFFLCY